MSDHPERAQVVAVLADGRQVLLAAGEGSAAELAARSTGVWLELAFGRIVRVHGE